MKRTSVIFTIALILLAIITHAATVQLAWDPSNTGTNSPIANYKVYWGVESGKYTNSVSSGTNLTATVTNLSKGNTYFFAATATDTNNLESDFSGEVSASIPTNPSAPPNFHITVTVAVDVNVNASAMAPKK
jgi:hypothetical protein